MKITVAFSTDDGENLLAGHFGSAKFYYFYEFGDGEPRLVEKRKNINFDEDESIKSGDPSKAAAMVQALAGADVLVNRRFGPNILRMMADFVCVISSDETIGAAVKSIAADLEKVAALKAPEVKSRILHL